MRVERRNAPIAALVALLGTTFTIAAPLAAQGPGVFEMLASRKQHSTDPLLGGIALAHYHGPIGLRFSGALNLTNAQDSVQSMPYQTATAAASVADHRDAAATTTTDRRCFPRSGGGPLMRT